MKQNTGKITIEDGANVWPHEMDSAKALTRLGNNIAFIPESDRSGEKRADCYINGELWEMKAPKGAKLMAIERNLKRATKQKARNIIFDSRRMKKVPDVAIYRELVSQFEKSSVIDRIIFINRKSEIIDIK